MFVFVALLILLIIVRIVRYFFLEVSAFKLLREYIGPEVPFPSWCATNEFRKKHQESIEIWLGMAGADVYSLEEIEKYKEDDPKEYRSAKQEYDSAKRKLTYLYRAAKRYGFEVRSLSSEYEFGYNKAP